MATINGEYLDQTTKDQILEAARLAGVSHLVYVIQGSRSYGSLSGNTHGGDGAEDLRIRNMTAAQAARFELNLRRVGQAAWIRNHLDGFDPHIHGIRSDCTTASAAAKRQVVAYRNGRNGLANNGPDRGPGGYRLMTWPYYLKLKRQNQPSTPTKPDTFPGHPKPYLFQRILLKAVAHERQGGPALEPVEKRYLALYRRSLYLLALKRRRDVKETWSTWSLVRAFQISYGLHLDGIPGTATCRKLAALAGYAHVA
jgi:hypothetical protein